MRAKNVSVSLYQQGDTLKVWCASFDIKGSVPRTKDGKFDEAAYHKKCQEIEKILSSMEFPDD